MKIECVHCGISGQLDETKIPPGATSIKCPACGERFPIPAAVSSAAVSSAVVSSAAVEVRTEAVSQPPAPSSVPPPPSASEPPPPASPADSAECTVCKGRFPHEDMVRFGDSRVCAACKPVYVQLLTQGTPRPGELRYAGFGIRLGAKILDGLILGLISFLISLAITLPFTKSSPKMAATGALLAFILQIVTYASYNGYFLSAKGATPGKMACGLQVVLASGGSISFGRGVGRYFAELLSSVTLCIGYLMVLFDAERRALHDRICNTRVVYK